MRRVGLSLLVLSGLVVGCSQPTAEDSAVPTIEVAAPPVDADETIEVIGLDPLNPSPGESFTASFRSGNIRGGYFNLFRWDGSDWGAPLYQLESDANGGVPSAIRIRDGVGGDDYDVQGPGPDGLVLPDDLIDGFWRICTANALDEACAQFEVR